MLAAIDVAVALEILQQRLQGDPVVALEVKGAGDLALADRGLAFADEGEDLFPGREGDGPGAPRGVRRFWPGPRGAVS